MPKKYKKRTLTPKQARFVQVLTETGNQTEAAVQAYNVKNRLVATTLGAEVAKNLKESFPQVMERVGISDDLIGQTLKDAMAAETSFFSKSAGDFVTIVDWQARLKAADIALKLKKHYPKEEKEVDHNVVFTITRGEETAVEAVIVPNTEQTDVNEGPTG